ncbi:uncharacterized protein LOC111994698 [Quercus suber]|uniref:uncharacterized protein LOC111994698 n=1 Tax=Quercus suber TaxID=58331 RepID=UPI0032DE5EE9
MSNTQVPRRSGRIVRPPIRFIGLGETYETISEEPKSDPYTYEEAMNDIDAHHWVQAMKSELDSMYSNQVWDLVKVPNDIKPVGCKWVYKRKRGIDGKVETFKARLVAKGYTQKEDSTIEAEYVAACEAAKEVVLLLDEPTSALDPISTENIEDVLVNLKKKQGMTIIMVSHSIKQIQRIADIVCLLVKGEIVEELRPDKLSEAKHPMALRFLQLSS